MRELLLGILVVLAAACSPRHFDNPERVRPIATPEERRTFGSGELHESMWTLARYVERVNVIMRRSSDPLTPEEQQEVIALLGSMEAVAERLSKDDARGLHPVLGENIDVFRMDLALSRKNASANPPNFFLAGTVAGSCAYCHGLAFDKIHAGLVKDGGG